MANVDDIVKVTGVSRSTVFRFMNGSNVRPEARKAIIQAMEKLNYKTDAIIKQRNISVEISISSNFEAFKGFSEVVQGITRRADEKGVKVNIVIRSKDQIAGDYERWNREEGVKGVIVVGKNMEDEEKEAEMLRANRIPHIFVNRMIEDPEIHYVTMDLKKAAYDMVSFLIRSGYRNIATIGYPKTQRVDRDKLEGYKKALQENEIKVSQNFYHEISDGEVIDKKIREMFEKGEIPEAFFAICDSQAMKFIHIAQAYGYKVPEDIAVAGMDDVEAAEYFKPALTTIHVPFRKMGMIAVDNLIQLITDREISSIKTVIAHTLVERESTRRRA